eukprot:1148458-Pelagomonas_calceolata.AAC.4
MAYEAVGLIEGRLASGARATAAAAAAAAGHSAGNAAGDAQQGLDATTGTMGAAAGAAVTLAQQQQQEQQGAGAASGGCNPPTGIDDFRERAQLSALQEGLLMCAAVCPALLTRPESSGVSYINSLNSTVWPLGSTETLDSTDALHSDLPVPCTISIDQCRRDTAPAAHATLRGPLGSRGSFGAGLPRLHTLCTGDQGSAPEGVSLHRGCMAQIAGCQMLVTAAQCLLCPASFRTQPRAFLGIVQPPEQCSSKWLAARGMGVTPAKVPDCTHNLAQELQCFRKWFDHFLYLDDVAPADG